MSNKNVFFNKHYKQDKYNIVITEMHLKVLNRVALYLFLNKRVMLWAFLVLLSVDFLSIMIIFTFRVLSSISTAYSFAAKLIIYV